MENNLYSYFDSLFKDGNIPSKDELYELRDLLFEGKSEDELKKMTIDFYRDGFMREILDEPMILTMTSMTAIFVREFENPDFDVLNLHFSIVSTAYMLGITNSRNLLDKRNHFSIDSFKRNIWDNNRLRRVLFRLFLTFLKGNNEIGYATEECLKRMTMIFFLILKVTSEYRTKAEIFDLYFRFYEPLDWRNLSGLNDKELKKYSKKVAPEAFPFNMIDRSIIEDNFESYKRKEEWMKRNLREYHKEVSSNRKYADSMEKAAEIVKILDTYCRFEDFKIDDESLENYSFEEIYAYNKAIQSCDSYQNRAYMAFLIISIIYNSRMPGDKDCYYLCNHRRLSECIAFTVYPYSTNADEALYLYVNLQYRSAEFTYPKDIKSAFRYRINKIKAYRDKKQKNNVE